MKIVVVVSPDIGGVVRARAIAKQLDDADLAIIDKRRPRANEAEVMNLIGDVEGGPPFWLTTWSIQRARCVLPPMRSRSAVPLKVVSYCTHAVLSGRRLKCRSSQLDELVVTDTIPSERRSAGYVKIRQLTIADLLAESIRRVSNEESISALFDLS